MKTKTNQHKLGAAMRLPIIEIYQRADNRWGWRLKASNGRQIAAGSNAKGWASERAAYENLRTVARSLYSGAHLPGFAKLTQAGPRKLVFCYGKPAIKLRRIG